MNIRESYNLIYKKDINKLHKQQQLHEFFLQIFFKTQEVWKLMYRSYFQNKKNMHFIVTMSNSHDESRLSLAPKRELFPMH